MVGVRTANRIADKLRDVQNNLTVVDNIPGSDAIMTGAGIARVTRDPNRLRFVGVVSVDSANDVVWVREIANGFFLGEQFAPELAFGYTAADFEQFIIEQAMEGPDGEPPASFPTPLSSDQFCVVWGGFLTPHYRFGLVDPPEVDTACIDPPPAAASTDSGCKGCGG